MGALLFLALLFFGTVGLVLYFAPTIVGFVRRVPNRGAVLAVNAFLGWTMIGWIAAMVLALRTPRHTMPPVLSVDVPAPDRPVFEARALEAAARELPEDPFVDL